MVKFITLKHELMDDSIFEHEEDQAEFEQAQPMPTPVMPTPVPTPVPDSIFQEEDQVELESAVAVGASSSTECITAPKTKEDCLTVRNCDYLTSEECKNECQNTCNFTPAPPTPGPPTPGGSAGNGCNNCGDWARASPNGAQCKELSCNPTETDCVCNDVYQPDGSICQDNFPSPACSIKDPDVKACEWCKANPSTVSPTPSGPVVPTPPAPTPPTPAPGPSTIKKCLIENYDGDGHNSTIYHETPSGSTINSCNDIEETKCTDKALYIEAWYILLQLAGIASTSPDKDSSTKDILDKYFNTDTIPFLKTFIIQAGSPNADNPEKDVMAAVCFGKNENGACSFRYLDSDIKNDAIKFFNNSGGKFSINDTGRNNFKKVFILNEKIEQCTWKDVSPGPAQPTPAPKPTPAGPQGDNPCFNGDCGETLCASLFTSPERNYISTWPPPESEKDKLNPRLKDYCIRDNNYNLFKLTDSSQCNNLDITTNTKLQDKLKYCFPNVSNKDLISPEEKNILNMKNCSCIDDNLFKFNDLPFLYDISSSSSTKIVRNSSKRIKTFDKRTDLAFWLENKSVQFKNCQESSDFSNPKCGMCGIQSFNENPDSFAKETDSARYIAITSDEVNGTTIKSCCPGFKGVCLNTSSDDLSPLPSSGKCSGGKQHICVYDNTTSYANNPTDQTKLYSSTNKYNILTAGSPAPDTPTPHPTASPFKFTISKSSYATSAGCQMEQKKGLNVEIKTSSPSPDIIEFKNLESQGTKCCIKQVSTTSDPKKKFIVGRNESDDDPTFCDTKVCNTNFIMPDNSDDIVFRGMDNVNRYFYGSNANQIKNNILIQDPDMCCKNFGLYEVKDEQTIKDMIGKNNENMRKQNLKKIYKDLPKYFTKKPITSWGPNKGLCLYIGDNNNRDKNLDEFSPKVPDQLTWNSGSVTPTPASCDATPGPCVINLVHQFGGRWWDYFQNNASPDLAFSGLNNNIKNEIKKLYLNYLITKILKPIDTLITTISKKDKNPNSCTDDCYCFLDEEKITSSLKLLPSINNKSTKTNNIFSIHKKGMIKKNITSKKILDTQATPGMLGAGEKLKLTEYVIFTVNGKNPDSADTTLYTKIQLKDDKDKQVIQTVLKNINSHIMNNSYYFNIDYEPDQNIIIDNTTGNPSSNYDTIWIRNGKNCADKDESSASQKNNSCAKGSYYDSNEKVKECTTFDSKKNCTRIDNNSDTINNYYKTSDYSNVPVFIQEVCTNFPTPAAKPT